MEHGKIPPQAVEIEETILGSLMNEAETFIYIIDIIEPKMFYKEQNQIIAETIWQMHKENRAVDMLTVTSRLKEKKAGITPYEIVQLCDKTTPSMAANIKHHAYIVNEKYMLRNWIEIADKGTEMAYNENFDVIEYGISEMQKLLGGIEKPQDYVKSVKNAKDEFTEYTESGVPPSLRFGLFDFDRQRFFEKGTLNVLAARPGMGKTAFALELSKRLAVNKQVGFLSLEMTTKQLVRRLVRGELDEQTTYLFDNYKAQGKDLETVYKAYDRIGDLNLHIEDKAGITLEHIKAKAKLMKMQFGIEFLVIDYLQLIRKNVRTTTNDAIGEITAGLKQLAKELDIPILLLSQLSRKVEDRGGLKIPNLADLRDSGNIEQDADSVVFLWRPEYYKIPTFEWKGKEIDGFRKTLCVIGKHREGNPSNWILLKNNENLSNYSDYIEEGLLQTAENPKEGMKPSDEVPF
jgi:replicative DNA helicase